MCHEEPSLHTRCDFHGPGVSCHAEGIILYMSTSAFGPRYSSAWSFHILRQHVLIAWLFKQSDAARSSLMSAEASGCSCLPTKKTFCGAKPRWGDFTSSDVVIGGHVGSPSLQTKKMVGCHLAGALPRPRLRRSSADASQFHCSTSNFTPERQQDPECMRATRKDPHRQGST